MRLCRQIRYRALALVIVIIATAAPAAGPAMAGSRSAGMVQQQEGVKSQPHRSHPMVLADAAVTIKGIPVISAPAAHTGMLIRPPGEKRLRPEAIGLSSAAIIRPIKEKKFALALVAATPATGQSARFGARPSIFKSSPALINAPGGKEPLQWVVLADALPARQDAMGAPADHDNGWRYSVEMIYMPKASMTLRAALAMARLEEDVATVQPPPIWERSRIGMSIGLGLRPKNGVLLDVDYAHVIKDVVRHLNRSGNNPSHPMTQSSGGDDLISISLSIQF